MDRAYYAAKSQEFCNYSYSYSRYTGVHMPAAESQVERMPSYTQFISKYDTHNNNIYTVILTVPICFAVLCHHNHHRSESAIPVFFM
jgi:hypothetical protein